MYILGTAYHPIIELTVLQNECNPRLILTQFKIALDLLKMCFWFKRGIILSPQINSEPSKLVETSLFDFVARVIVT